MQDVIKTDRLVLRRLKRSDAQNFSKHASDWDIARMTGSIPYPFPVISAEIKIEMMLSQFRRGLAYPYAITLKDDDNLIGIMDLFRRPENTDFEIGYWVGKSYWGNGYGPEAACAMLGEAHKKMGLNRFIAGVFSDNPASMRVLEKLGFKQTGSDEVHFSMARLCHYRSISFELDVESPRSNRLHSQQAKAIEAT